MARSVSRRDGAKRMANLDIRIEADASSGDDRCRHRTAFDEWSDVIAGGVGDPAESSPPPLFAYGTLQHPEVLRSLLQHVPSKQPAVLRHHAVYALRNRPYPTCVVSMGSVTHGTLLQGLSHGDWWVLDVFEDPGYELSAVSVELEDGREVDALVYRSPEGESPPLAGAWSLRDFQTHHLMAYQQTCAQVREAALAGKRLPRRLNPKRGVDHGDPPPIDHVRPVSDSSSDGNSGSA